MFGISRLGDRPRSMNTVYTSDGRLPQLPSPVTVGRPGIAKAPSFFSVFKFRGGHSSKKPLVFLSVIGAVLILSGGAGAYFVSTYYHPKVVPTAKIPVKKYVPPKPTIVPSTLTGLPVDPAVNDRTVTAVMIENSILARPQSGLDQAGVVFEALAEGGVTRFMAIFQDTQPDYIGPVRSARPYYIGWALGFDAAYAHVGGSPDGLQDIASWNVKDLNEFYNAGAYQRISSRYAPHNVYTSIGQLNQLEEQKHFGKSNFTGFTRKPEEPVPTATVSTIDMSYSGIYYNAHYDYDRSTNTYKRSEDGAPHLELHKDGSQAQIAPKVVIGMVIPYQTGALDSSGAYYSNYSFIGSGQVFIFQDGTMQTGTWTKSSNTSQLSFTDAQGKPLKLDNGQAWIAALKSTGDLTYK